MAFHPNWNSVLLLSKIDGTVIHEGHGSRGSYQLTRDMLTIHWETYGPDRFFNVAGIYIHHTFLKNLPEIDCMPAFMIGGKPVSLSKIHVLIPGSDHEVGLRLRTSDIPTFIQIFVNAEYESPAMPMSAGVIVDLGANIGLATVFFGLKYPEAKILAVEPEAANFAAMIGNTAALGDRVQMLRAAVWTRDGKTMLRMKDDGGDSLGEWGAQVTDTQDQRGSPVTCYKLTTLLDKAGFGDVDILKIDIEGAELELFSERADDWLPRINLIIVETHDRFRPGSEAAVRNAVDPMFEELPRSGENLIFRRR